MGEGDSDRELSVAHQTDIASVRRVTRAMAHGAGFEPGAAEEIALAATELASNLVRHAGHGTFRVTVVQRNGRQGIDIVARDDGPGIPDIERAMTDGHSTAGGLGYGLGAASRHLDEFTITSGTEGTRVAGTRWLPARARSNRPAGLTFGAASRRHPRMRVNGDSFVIKTWNERALLGVIDGLGHGQFAHRAAEAARHYLEQHCELPIPALFQGVARACRATRGVVMALAVLDWGQNRLSLAGIGNVEVRMFGSPERLNSVVRRGVLGGTAPQPVVTEHAWGPGRALVMSTDGVSPRWDLAEFPGLLYENASVSARHLLRALAHEHDDATVVVASMCES